MTALRDCLRLYLVTDPQLCCDFGLIETVRSAVAGGVTMVQLRDKTATTRELIKMAIALKQALAGTGIPIIINDDVAAAVTADVDGAHIGQEDMSPIQARAILGVDKILGVSCETPQAIQKTDQSLVNYLGLGPVFGTTTKDDHKQPIGFDGLAHLATLSSLPNVAIGGLKSHHSFDVHKSGSDGMAVVSAICGQINPYAAARKFKKRRICNDL